MIYHFGGMMVFFMLFDGMISYLLPLVITEHGISKSLMGVILGTAAISGAFFDFTIYKIFKTAVYRRLFIAMFMACFVYLFLVWTANSFLLFVAAMAVWGFFYDLKSFGTLDFMSRYSKKDELPSNFGFLQVFQSIGALLAPLIAGFVIIETVGWEPFALAAVFLLIAIFFFVVLLLEVRNKEQLISHHPYERCGGFLEEIVLWRKVGLAILPVLLLGAFSTVLDSFFMAIGPILAEALPIEPFDGIFMFAYLLPPLLLGGLTGRIIMVFGEKRTSLFGLLIGSAILSVLFLFQEPLLIILMVFVSSCFTCMMVPVVQSIYACCICEKPKAEKEIQELGDFSSNLGYIIGPVAAGITADYLGNLEAFSVLGVIGIGFALVLFVIMPKKSSVIPPARPNP